MFSTQRASRDAYQRLFRDRRIEKTYEALAPALPGLAFPLQRDSRLVPGEPFFRMSEVPGEPNARSRIELIEAEGPIWRYRLLPETYRKHQLRVHMAMLGRRSWVTTCTRSFGNVRRTSPRRRCSCWRGPWPSTTH